MGCDIHTHVEFYHEASKTWKDGDKYFRNPYFDVSDEHSSEFNRDELCGNRNYMLFAILADVRNESNVEYICPPKGIPEDCNIHIKKDYDAWEEDAHSASYFTLKELMKYFADHREVTYGGMVSPEAAKKIDDFGEAPDWWCSSTNRPGYVFRTWSLGSPLVHLIEALKQRAKELFWLYDENRIPEVADKIRFVFWFDN